MRRPRLIYAIGVAAATLAFATGGVAVASSARTAAPTAPSVAAATPATPIKHLVVIFDENISFDHYFGTYPFAPNPAGEPAFHSLAATPTVNGLYSNIGTSGPTGPLLSSNPNGSNPKRLDHNDPMTCDQGHGYSSEQLAADHGAEDAYPANTGKNTTLDTCLTGLTFNGKPEPIPAGAHSNFAVLDYYDGNTVTALWNYAQHYAMSDNYFGTTYGPSTLGALNVSASNTYGAICGPASATFGNGTCLPPAGLNVGNPLLSNIKAGAAMPAGPGTTVGDADPTFDICSYLPSSDGGDNKTAAATLTMGGNNIGVELSTANLTWGWFEGGFDHGFVPGHGTKPTTAQICSQSHKNVGSTSVTDYVPHHEPFQFYASTANPMHRPPSSVAMPQGPKNVVTGSLVVWPAPRLNSNTRCRATGMFVRTGFGMRVASTRLWSPVAGSRTIRNSRNLPTHGSSDVPDSASASVRSLATRLPSWCSARFTIQTLSPTL